MYLVQLLPRHDNNDQDFPHPYFNAVREDLTGRLGGTAFLRSPAVGLWKEGYDVVNRDDVVMFEVLTEQLDQVWWDCSRTHLQKTFRQDEVLIWASVITRL